MFIHSSNCICFSLCNIPLSTQFATLSFAQKHTLANATHFRWHKSSVIVVGDDIKSPLIPLSLARLIPEHHPRFTTHSEPREEKRTQTQRQTQTHTQPRTETYFCVSHAPVGGMLSVSSRQQRHN